MYQCWQAGQKPQPRQHVKLFSGVRAQPQAYVAAHRLYASSGGLRSAGRDSALEHESLTTAECPSSGGLRSAGRDSALEHESLTTAECPPAFSSCLGSCLQTHCSHRHTRTTVARAPVPNANPRRARRGLLLQVQHCVSAMHAACQQAHRLQPGGSPPKVGPRSTRKCVKRKAMKISGQETEPHMLQSNHGMKLWAPNGRPNLTGRQRSMAALIQDLGSLTTAAAAPSLGKPAAALHGIEVQGSPHAHRAAPQTQCPSRHETYTGSHVLE